MVQTQPKYKQKNTPFVLSTFTGKERDSETGFSYFGARYYDSDLMTGWLSVDPLADKYPSLSPYAYCGWKPVRLVDPDGEATYR
ncbi:MAG: RHS repeat-associated core domain-containing protein [Bacteroidales bacterium]|nr:RHS repeat-associated core domain-containing protein [Bacteroidales bacterium]